MVKRMQIMFPHQHDIAVAAFIGTKGITRCPAACAVPTQATIAAADRAALADHAARRERLREQRLAAWKRSFRIYAVRAAPGE
jgi:hypothetical protein